MHKCVCVECEHSQRRVPCITIGAKAYALGMAGRACTVDDISTALVEVVVEQQQVICLCCLYVADMLVAIAGNLIFAEGCSPKAYFVNLTIESVRFISHCDSFKSRECGVQFRRSCADECCVAVESYAAFAENYCVMVPFVADDVVFFGSCFLACLSDGQCTL